MERIETIKAHLNTNTCKSTKNSYPIASHALDTSTGLPASGLYVRLSKKVGESDNGNIIWKVVSKRVLNGDGRNGGEPLVKSIIKGEVYEMLFNTKKYFQGKKCFYPFVKIVFEIEDENAH